MSLTVHELRTPVTVVSGYLRMLLKEQGGPLTEKQRKMLEEAERSCSRISALVAEMSDLGKLESGDASVARQEVDVAAVLSSLATDMHEGEDRGVRLELRGVDKPLTIQGDRVRIEAALRALLHAALRERGEPGEIVAQCGTDDSTVLITIGDDQTQHALVAAPPDRRTVRRVARRSRPGAPCRAPRHRRARRDDVGRTRRTPARRQRRPAAAR
jgi:signal transduction histidine kinase